jgi:hypothetical protein
MSHGSRCPVIEREDSNEIEGVCDFEGIAAVGNERWRLPSSDIFAKCDQVGRT